jgi:hypothetical protein
VGCYFYSQENRFIDMASFRLCYNLNKHKIRLGLYLRVTSSLVGHRSYWALGPDEYLWCRQPCCENVGSGFPLIPVYCGIFILLLNTINKYSLGSGCHCATIAGRNIWMLHSRALGRAPPTSGTLLTYILSHNGRTSISCRRRLMISEGNLS